MGVIMNSFSENKKSSRPGFTIMEVLIATILIGLAVAALVGSNRAFSAANGAGVNLSTAEFLIEEIRELTTSLAVVDPQTETTVFGPESTENSLSTYDDLDDFDGQVFSPPIDINRTTLNNFTAFSQRITVENVSPANFTNTVADHGSDFVRVTVDILLNGNQISSTSWIRARL